MSKVTCIDSGDLYNLSCGHIISAFDVEGPPTLGDEVACPICAEMEKKVKAARVEMLDYIEGKLDDLEGIDIIIEGGTSEGYYISKEDIEETFNDITEAEK